MGRYGGTRAKSVTRATAAKFDAEKRSPLEGEEEVRT